MRVATAYYIFEKKHTKKDKDNDKQEKQRQYTKEN